MNAGVAEQIGTPLEVYETPATLFAAQFIGSPAMNIFDAVIDQGSVMLGKAKVAETRSADGPVKLGIRPEHIIRDDSGPVEVSVQIAEPLGANTLLHGQLVSGEGGITVSLPGVHLVGSTQHHTRLSFQPDHIHLFDPATGSRR